MKGKDKWFVNPIINFFYLMSYPLFFTKIGHAELLYIVVIVIVVLLIWEVINLIIFPIKVKKFNLSSERPELIRNCAWEIMKALTTNGFSWRLVGYHIKNSIAEILAFIVMLIIAGNPIYFRW